MLSGQLTELPDVVPAERACSLILIRWTHPVAGAKLVTYPETRSPRLGSRCREGFGKRKIEEFGARCPSPDTIRWIADFARRAPRVVLKGIYRYRSHEEADRDAKEWVANGVVERVLMGR
jgi:hypothetical protein